ncbi:MAG: HD domain-containing protein [Syntrophomonadaceae bacterium]|nr:HD domain-containing protein [Syntrophomonadaceae bacterium]
MEIAEAEKIIRDRLSPSRYQHSMQVARMARQLARQFNENENQAYLAGILHDYAKGISGGELLNLAEAYGLIEDEVERLAPDLLHARIGAELLARDWGVEDKELLQAISNHTLGRVGMAPLEKILFLADMIEPGRDFPGIDRLRCIADRDLDRGMVLATEFTLQYCMGTGRLIHPRTVLVRNNLLTALPKETSLW